MKTVQLLGTSQLNIKNTPSNVGAERWCANDPTTYIRIGYPSAIETWTRWFNVHSKNHILLNHPNAYPWYLEQDGSKPIYLRDADETIPGSIVFPGPMLQDHFRISRTEKESFFTCQVTWLIALAIYEQFERIEMWGYTLGRGSIKGRKYEFERPAVHYWIGRARQAGVEVILPPEAQLCHTNYLYGYHT